jgi:hypothetical protein
LPNITIRIGRQPDPDERLFFFTTSILYHILPKKARGFTKKVFVDEVLKSEVVLCTVSCMSLTSHPKHGKLSPSKLLGESHETSLPKAHHPL